ncbi:MAG TPA: hypothetical protein VLA34_02175, partial [Candidatus Krumholzibacterium sp.]|nr:hypothetical protein [Candidatus Krumholzibacterium sp.]
MLETLIRKSGVAMTAAVIMSLRLAGPAAADGGAVLVTPVLDHPVEREANLVYCGTFQMAWDRMTREMIGEKILLDERTGLVDRLNRNMTSGSGAGGQDPPGCLVMAGYGRDSIADRINEELKRRFGDGAPLLDRSLNDDDVILAYAFLDKVSRFVNPFQRYDSPLVFAGPGGGRAVRAFGAGYGETDGLSAIRGQAEVLEYRRGGGFIVRLATGDEEEELILASVEPCATLLETCEEVEWRVAAASAEPLGPSDVLVVPLLDLSATRSFTPLLGRHLLNEGFREYFVAEARQDVRFRLDESGTSLGSSGTFVLEKGGPEGKSLIFRNPFLLYLKR